MDEDARTPDAVSVGDLDRRLLQLLATGHSTVGAGEMVGLTLAGTALRLQALRQRLGVASTVAAVDLVFGGDHLPDRRHEPPSSPDDDPASGTPSERQPPAQP